MAFYLASFQAFILAFYLASILTFLLASILAFYMASFQAFYPASILALLLASILAFYRAPFRAFILAFLTGSLSHILSGVLSLPGMSSGPCVLYSILGWRFGVRAQVRSTASEAGQNPELAIWSAGPGLTHWIRSC